MSTKFAVSNVSNKPIRVLVPPISTPRCISELVWAVLAFNSIWSSSGEMGNFVTKRISYAFNITNLDKKYISGTKIVEKNKEGSWRDLLSEVI